MDEVGRSTDVVGQATAKVDGFAPCIEVVVCIKQDVDTRFTTCGSDKQGIKAFNVGFNTFDRR